MSDFFGVAKGVAVATGVVKGAESSGDPASNWMNPLNDIKTAYQAWQSLDKLWKGDIWGLSEYDVDTDELGVVGENISNL